MGLEHTSPKIYLSIFDGKITRQYKTAVPGVTTTRMNKNNEQVHEQYWEKLTGFLTKIEVRTTEFQNKKRKQYQLTINDGGPDDYMLQFPYKSRIASTFLNPLRNIDFTKQITFIPWKNTKKDPPVTSLYLNQDGESVKWAFTKDEPGEMPPMEEITVDGEKKWDSTKQLNFFDWLLETEIRPVMEKANKSRVKTTAVVHTGEALDGPMMGDDENDFDDSEQQAAEKDFYPDEQPLSDPSKRPF